MKNCNECTHRFDCTKDGVCDSFELNLEEHDKNIRNTVINKVKDKLNHCIYDTYDLEKRRIERVVRGDMLEWLKDQLV